MSLRTGGREAVEDTPVTGATEEQIEAAAFAALADYFDGDLDATNLYWQGGDGAKGTLKTVDQWAEFLVPVGYVIVRAEDALTAEDRAAIGRALETFDADTDLFIARSETDSMTDDLRKAYDRYHRAKQEFTTADRESLRTIAAGGQA